MEGVSVTPEMRARVLAGVAAALEDEAPETAPEVALEKAAEEVPEEAAETPRKGFTLLASRRYLALAACLLIVLIVGITLLPRPTLEPEQQGGDGTQEGLTYYGAPLELATREELASEVSVPVPEVPMLAAQATKIEYVSLWGDIAEVRYLSDKGKACLRVSPKPGDNSGDYNDYKVVKTLSHNGVTATLKGTNDGYYLALWDQGGYGMSIGFDYPVSYDTLAEYVRSAIEGMSA